ncbi:MAG: N-acetyltransferase family protein [Sphaerochaeta sp.]|uniref:GNAT family N-acetyltransferase n=1 Tax=Sphaerochaeta sp. TaxID=1972642 RepID=UPI003D0D957F
MIVLRIMEARDIEAVEALILQLAQDLGESFSIGAGQSAAHFQAMKQSPDIYQNVVACIDAVVVGFLSVVRYRSFFHHKGTALVNELVVAKEYRGMHIGSALLEHAADCALTDGFDEIEVGVMQENIRAISFYRRHGFSLEYLLLGREFCT